MATANDEIVRRIQSGQMTDAQAKQLLAQAGITVTPGEGRVQNYLLANPQVDMMLKGMLNGISDRGSMPIGIEPIHSYERTALEQLGKTPYSAGTALMNPQFTQAIERSMAYGDKADAALQSGMRGFDAGEMQQYMNPYTEQVINRSTARLSEEGERMKQAMIDSMSKRGSATMGDMYGAQQMGDISKELVSKTGDLTAGLNYQGWTDAVAQLERQRQRALQGGTTYAGMMNPAVNAGATAQGATFDAQRLGLETLDAQAGAGQRIQTFNQGVADIAMGDYMGGRNFPNTLVNQALTQYPGIQGNVPYNTTTQPNYMNMAGAGLTTLGKNIGGGSSNPNPYVSPAQYAAGGQFPWTPSNFGF